MGWSRQGASVSSEVCKATSGLTRTGRVMRECESENAEVHKVGSALTGGEMLS
jgi:hypothetical protein